MKKRKEYPQDFIEICEVVDEKVAKKRAILELELLEKKQFQMLFGAIIFLMIFILVAFANNTIKMVAWGILIVTVITIIIYTILAELKILKKKVDFKEDVLSEFAVHIKDGFIYDRNGEISESKYRKSGFNRVYNDFFSNAYIEGIKNGRNIGIANVIIKQNRKNNKMEEVFKGAFAYANLKESINEIDLMKINSKNNKKEKYYLEETNLYMYSENTTYAKKIFDDSIIYEINNLKKELNLTLECMVNKNTLYIRFFVDNMNNTLLYASENEKEMLYKYYRIINFMDSVATKIEMNIMTEKKEGI